MVVEGADEFPVNFMQLERHEIDTISMLRIRPGLGKQFSRSAVRHLDQAYRTREVDTDMAVFRLLTAEEEAASAILYITKRINYDGHRNFKINSHEHRYAVLPFITICVDFFQSIPETKDFDPKLLFDSAEQRLKISCSAAPFGQPKLRFEPVPPLNFRMDINGQAYHFENEMKKMCNDHNITKLISHIKERVSRRHSLLYASDHGLGKVTNVTDEFLLCKEETCSPCLWLTFLLIKTGRSNCLFSRRWMPL